ATHPRIIENNAPGCEDQNQIAAACLEPFPCMVPLSVNVLPTSDSATITWQSLGSSFDIQWGFADFELGEGLGSQNNISELNYLITDLILETDYDFYIRRNCTDTDGQSEWVKVSFSTLTICPSGDITLYSQQDVDNFGAMYPDCTEIEGYLDIGYWYNGSNNITDISALSNLVSVGGLGIYYTQLTNLNDLSLLTSTGFLYIENNNQIINLN